MFVTSYVSFYAANVDSHLMYVLQLATLASSCQSLLIYIQYPWKLSSNFMAPTILFQNNFHDNSGKVSSKHPHLSCTARRPRFGSIIPYYLTIRMMLALCIDLKLAEKDGDSNNYASQSHSSAGSYSHVLSCTR